jgi:hypothetical protein
MAGNVYRQYVWLLDLINRHDGIQFREISDAWQISPLNETRSRLPRRTFINHLHKIREIFGVDIECTTGYNYRVVYSNDIDLDNAQQSLLAHLQLSNALFANPNMAGRISLDGYLSFRYFTPLIGAMEQNRVVEIHHLNRTREEHSYIKIEPYYIKQFESGWFVVGQDISKRAICAYAFSDIVAVRESEDGEQFEMPDKEWLREFMRTPQFDNAQPNNNAQYIESLQKLNSRIRRGRWGSYISEDYKAPEK